MIKVFCSELAYTSALLQWMERSLKVDNTLNQFRGMSSIWRILIFFCYNIIPFYIALFKFQQHAILKGFLQTEICNIYLRACSYMLKVTGRPFWHFAENRYCALCMQYIQVGDFHQIFTKCSPVHAKYDKVIKLTNNKIM